MAATTPRVVEWSAEQAATWATPATPSIQAANAMVLECIALAEVLWRNDVNFVAAAAGTDPAAPQPLNTRINEAGQVVVGETIVAAIAGAKALPTTDARAQMILALAETARTIALSQHRSAGGLSRRRRRGAGWVVLAAQVGRAVAVLVVSVAASWVINRVATIVADDRVKQAGIVQAGADYARRLDEQRRTGTMPPPSAMETSSAAAVTSAATAARQDSALDRAITTVARTGSKIMWIGAALVGGYIVVNSSK